MSHTPQLGCLVLCLMTLAPATTTRADDSGPSPRRKAEIDALIAKKRTEKQKRARVAAIRDAETARQFSEARAYEIHLAQAFATYQLSLERQTMMQEYWLDRSTAGLGYPAYTSGPVFVNLNPPVPVSEACHVYPAHSRGPVGREQIAHGAPHVGTVHGVPQVGTALHQGHAR